MDEERKKKLLEKWAKVDPSEIRIVSPFGPDEPLETFLSAVFGIKRMPVINTDAKGKKHVLRVLKKFANDQGLEFRIFNAKGANVEDIRGEIEIVWEKGMPYHQRNKPAYWPKSQRMIVVEGVNQETDEEVLRAFLYVACMPYGEGSLNPEQLPYGSGFVFLAYNDFPVQRCASITAYFRNEYTSIAWPPAPYTKERVIYETKVAMQNIEQLYQQPFINWRGKTRDPSRQLYTEVIAEELLQANIAKELEKLPCIQRKKGYRVETHDGTIERQTNREEEIVAKKIFDYSKQGNNLGDLGEVFDYQVPLKNTQDDKAGKIDLVSFDRNTNTAWLVELKKGSSDTLLRCMLEIATYYQLLDKDLFIESYRDGFGNLGADCICKAVLVYKEQSQHKEIKEIIAGKRPNLKRLADALKIIFFLIEEEGPAFTVERVMV
ncbi:MAG: hypothetical protein HPY58_12555 [Firmicutes bacterium]|nr:hypothetical protein [Bacillota bacterium]